MTAASAQTHTEAFSRRTVELPALSRTMAEGYGGSCHLTGRKETSWPKSPPGGRVRIDRSDQSAVSSGRSSVNVFLWQKN